MKRHLCTLLFCAGLADVSAQSLEGVMTEGDLRACITTSETNRLRTYTLTSNVELRDNRPPEKQVTFTESPAHARIRTGNVMFDGLYAMAVAEALQNSVEQIKDHAYNKGEPFALKAYQTGEFWTYVWTRDLSYSVALGLGQFDPERAASSLLFKTSKLKASVSGGVSNQIVQDTGSGGSYPVSSDRIVWAMGADATLKFLPAAAGQKFLKQVYPILRDTLEQDRRVIFDPADGLYRGEQSFLDWREQTYPDWTKDRVVAIASSKSLSMNVANHFALCAAADYAGRLNRPDEQARYAAWAKDLKTAINREFFYPQTGIYSTYLLADPADGVRVRRYDLLGESLAILSGVTDEGRAEDILENYPSGPYGPPVVWPQEATVPIYHNQAIWPFVTAFWTKAAQKGGNLTAVEAGIHSLMRGAAFNLSHMENFDFVTGKAHVKTGALTGPVINSRRQLWSVAGYLGMVQDVVFGLDTARDSIRFTPFITGQMRDGLFAQTEVLELDNFAYRGKTIRVRVHLPAGRNNGRGVCAIDRIELNGKTIGPDLVPATALTTQNRWDIYLHKPKEDSGEKLTNVAGPRERFGPAQPQWGTAGQGGLTVENHRLTLHFKPRENPNTVFNLYRDGRLCARGITGETWTDAACTDFEQTVHHYALEAVDVKTGNASHLSPARAYITTNNQQILPAKVMENRGGKLVNGHHFADWGKHDDELRVRTFTVKQSGAHLIRAEFSNGSGPVNTGITCAVKRLEIFQTGSDQPVAAGYLVMPQSNDWNRYDLSTVIRADLCAGQTYSLRLYEDEYSRNMSYLTGNERYTAGAGGGAEPYNFVNIASVQLQHVAR